MGIAGSSESRTEQYLLSASSMVRSTRSQSAFTSRTVRRPRKAIASPAALLFAIGAETDAQFLFSRTNWEVGSPNWTDGNELADLPTEQIKTATTTGNLITDVLRLDQDRNRTRGPDTVGLTAIAVVVR